MTIRVKRVYDPPQETDGRRVLVDRLWPRGLSKERAQIDLWTRDIAPSNELRRWYGHDADKWDEFQARYASELDANSEGVRRLVEFLHAGDDVTFVFSSKEERLNNAFALKSYLDSLD